MSPCNQWHDMSLLGYSKILNPLGILIIGCWLPDVGSAPILHIGTGWKACFLGCLVYIRFTTKRNDISG